MADFIPTELTPDMLKAGVDALREMVPCSDEWEQKGVEEFVTRIWAACAIAYDTHGRQPSLWEPLRGLPTRH